MDESRRTTSGARARTGPARALRKPLSTAVCGPLAWATLVACSGGTPGRGFSPPEAGLETGTGAPEADGAVSVDATGDSEAGSGATFCAAQTSHTFCEDFDEGVPGQLDATVYGGGAVAPDTSDFESPLESLWANTPALTAPGATAGALVTASFQSNGTHLRLEAALQIGAGCVQNADGVVVAALAFPSSSLSLRANDEGSSLVEVDGELDDGGPAQGVPHPLSRSLSTGDWSVVVIDVSLLSPAAPAAVTVQIDGETVLAAEPLGLTIAIAPTVAITLGAAVANDVAQSPGCTVHVDDVLLDTALLNDSP